MAAINRLRISFSKFLCVSLFIAFSSCNDEEVIKRVNWSDKVIVLERGNGGATTSFDYNISVLTKGFFGTNKKLLFRSYSEPGVDDMKVSGDTLKLICFVSLPGTYDTINIPLNSLDKFIEQPVHYYRYKLEKTNDAFREPQFIIDGRESDKRSAL